MQISKKHHAEVELYLGSGKTKKPERRFHFRRAAWIFLRGADVAALAQIARRAFRLDVSLNHLAAVIVIGMMAGAVVQVDSRAHEFLIRYRIGFHGMWVGGVQTTLEDLEVSFDAIDKTVGLQVPAHAEDVAERPMLVGVHLVWCLVKQKTQTCGGLIQEALTYEMGSYRQKWEPARKAELWSHYGILERKGAIPLAGHCEMAY